MIGRDGKVIGYLKSNGSFINLDKKFPAMLCRKWLKSEGTKIETEVGQNISVIRKTAAFGWCLALNISVASAQEITAIDFNGDLIGKVIPDGKVVSFEIS